MTRGNLVLWMLVYPWPTVLAGLGLALGVYAAARPRETEGCDDLKVEAWRLGAMVAAAPAFFLGAEVILWAWLLAYRAPFVFTGLPYALGLVLAGLAAVPLLAAWCRRSRHAGEGQASAAGHPYPRAAAIAAALACTGLGLMVVGMWARDRAWAEVVARADGGGVGPASMEIVRLKSHRYVTAASAEAALDRALPTPGDVVALVDSAGGLLDRDLRAYLARRLETALERNGGDPGGAAVPHVWRLTDDPARALRAYALTNPELRAAALSADPPDVQAMAAAALAPGVPRDVAETAAAATDAAVGSAPLVDPLRAALVARLDDPAPVGPTALGILLRDGAEASLRPILPRFVGSDGGPTDQDGPAWTELRARCMQRTTALVALTTDADPAVAAGAKAVLGWVRQNCRRARPVG